MSYQLHVNGSTPRQTSESGCHPLGAANLRLANEVERRFVGGKSTATEQRKRTKETLYQTYLHLKSTRIRGADHGDRPIQIERSVREEEGGLGHHSHLPVLLIVVPRGRVLPTLAHCSGVYRRSGVKHSEQYTGRPLRGSKGTWQSLPQVAQTAGYICRCR